MSDTSMPAWVPLPLSTLQTTLDRTSTYTQTDSLRVPADFPRAPADSPRLTVWEDQDEGLPKVRTTLDDYIWTRLSAHNSWEQEKRNRQYEVSRLERKLQVEKWQSQVASVVPHFLQPLFFLLSMFEARSRLSVQDRREHEKRHREFDTWLQSLLREHLEDWQSGRLRTTKQWESRVANVMLPLLPLYVFV
ncbi:hypothetical protein EJ06DRAFT_254769 [Trichodelitschia bisporula]|uniref:Uncharacterized protein n=1 Tax=Trichodelitschia bisporula TaxID=703511 RepID=A0A6G1HJP0_9PEZI|nr:hypothetical protein EJ06DRAFT_254769 [Trichodelitschia bisporula]